MSDVNIPLLRKAVEWAEAEAAKPVESREWEQGFYIWRVTERDGERPNCGTCYCIAGYVAQSLDARYAESETVDGVHVSNFAANALGIPTEMEHSRAGGKMWDHLFSGGNDIDDVRRIAELLAGERL